MPLSHVEVATRAIIKGPFKIVEVKLSPYRMVLLRGDVQSVQAFTDCFKKLKTIMMTPGSQQSSKLALGKTPTDSIMGLEAPPVSTDVTSLIKPEHHSLDERGSSDVDSELQVDPPVLSAQRIKSRVEYLTQSKPAKTLIKLNKDGRDAVQKLDISQAIAAITKPPEPLLVLEVICRPYLFKSATRDWEKLARCILRVYSIYSKGFISLNIQGTETCILSATLVPTTSVIHAGDRKFIMNIVSDQGSTIAYTLRFLTHAEACKAQEAIQQEIKRSIHTCLCDVRSRLLIAPQPSLPKSPHPIVSESGCTQRVRVSESPWMDVPNFHIRRGYKHRVAYITCGNPPQTKCLGPVATYIANSGPRLDERFKLPDTCQVPTDAALFLSTRLVAVSTLSPTTRIVDVELDSEHVQISPGESTVPDQVCSTVTIKIFYGDGVFEYAFECTKDDAAPFRKMVEAAIEKSSEQQTLAKSFIEQVDQEVAKRVREREEAEKLQTDKLATLTKLVAGESEFQSIRMLE
eukprot:jgi/Hompol1/3536/HPOL_003272-RA